MTVCVCVRRLPSFFSSMEYVYIYRCWWERHEVHRRGTPTILEWRLGETTRFPSRHFIEPILALLFKKPPWIILLTRPIRQESREIARSLITNIFLNIYRIYTGIFIWASSLFWFNLGFLCVEPFVLFVWYFLIYLFIFFYNSGYGLKNSSNWAGLSYLSENIFQRLIAAQSRRTRRRLSHWHSTKPILGAGVWVYFVFYYWTGSFDGRGQFITEREELFFFKRTSITRLFIRWNQQTASCKTKSNPQRWCDVCSRGRCQFTIIRLKRAERKSRKAFLPTTRPTRPITFIIMWHTAPHTHIYIYKYIGKKEMKGKKKIRLPTRRTSYSLRARPCWKESFLFC